MHSRRALCIFACGYFLATAILRPQTTGADEASCRQFVQQFYDWYLAKNAAWFDVPKTRPEGLSPELRSLLRKEEKTQNSCRCIDHLDADPFLNSQDPDPKYTVQSVSVSSGKCLATVRGGTTEVRPELQHRPTGWVFINFHHSFYSEDRKQKLFPDDDLLHMLRR